MGTIAFMPDRTKCHWNMGNDPRERHNFIEHPAVTTYLKHPDGTVVNACQKPPELSRWFVGNHIKPGSNVLVIGAGAGGDVFGALEAGANVVAIEKDHQQFVSLGAELCKIAEEENVDEGNDEKMESDKKSKKGKSETNKPDTSDSIHKVPKGKKSSNQTSAPAVLPDCIICGEIITEDDVKNGYVCEACDKSRIVHKECLKKTANGRMACPSHAALQDSGAPEPSQTY